MDLDSTVVEKIIRIDAPWFVAGVVVGIRAAPIVRYMARWSSEAILAYCQKRGWKAELL